MLQAIGDEHACTVAIDFYLTGDNASMSWASGMVSRCWESSIPTISDRLDQKRSNRDERLKLITLLGATYHRNAAPTLISLIEGNQPHSEPIQLEIIRAFENIGLPAVPALINALDRPNGRGVNRVLYFVTKERFDCDKERWLTWWRPLQKEVEADFLRRFPE